MKPKNSPTHKRGDVVEVTIESLSYSGGRGVGRVDGVVIFVAGTAPGDQIRARVRNAKPRFLEGELLQILRPAPSRREPPCSVADRCGGCSWQHVEYSEQVVQKQGILTSSLRGLQKFAPFTVRPLLAAANEFHYRNRIQLQFRNGQFGFFAKGTNDLVRVDECWISEPALNSRIKALSASDAAGSARVELAILEGDASVVAGRRSPEMTVFAQVNRAQNEVLKAEVLKLIHGQPDWAFDLYAGSGNLSVPLAQHLNSQHLNTSNRNPTQVTAVELSGAAVERHRSNEGIDWQVGDVAAVLSKLKVPSGNGLIVLDPPRTGCEREVIDQLIRFAAKQIIYVSCNPSTFARDAERLVQSGKYQIESVQGLDMFPQTEHVELICSLKACDTQSR